MFCADPHSALFRFLVRQGEMSSKSAADSTVPLVPFSSCYELQDLFLISPLIAPNVLSWVSECDWQAAGRPALVESD